VDQSRPVLHVITRLEAGGAPLSVLPLLEGLTRAGIPIELVTGITPPPALDMLPEAQALGIPIYIIPSLRRDPHLYYDLKSLLVMRQIFRRRRPLLVHAHTSKAGFIARLAALLADSSIKRIYSPHGTILQGYFTSYKRGFFTWLERIAAHWTDAIIGLTVEESESYLDAGIGSRHKHLQISISIDRDTFAPPDPPSRLTKRRAQAVEDEEVLLISVGRLVPVKDHATLVRGLCLLKDTSTPWKCWIVGSGPEKEQIHRMVVEEGLQDRVRLWGYREDVNRLMSLADIFVLTSVNEGFGRVLLEAMAARLAIVATNVGGVPTVLEEGKAGYMVPPRDPGTLAEALDRLITSPDEREEWARLGYERVRTAFDLETTVQQHITLYKRVLRA